MQCLLTLQTAPVTVGQVASVVSSIKRPVTRVSVLTDHTVRQFDITEVKVKVVQCVALMDAGTATTVIYIELRV